MLTENQLKAQISTIVHARRSDSIIGIHAPVRWAGAAEIQVDGVDYRIISAETELELRAALAEPIPEGKRPVVVTTLRENEVGEDLRYRFREREFHTLSAKDLLQELFQAKEIDPRLGRLKWMATTLAELKPDGGYAPPPQGTLDQDTAWGAFLSVRLGLSAARPDLVTLLGWSRNPRNVERWATLESDPSKATSDWLAAAGGSETELIWSALRKNPRESVIALGLAALVLFERDDLPSDIAVARGKYETLFFDGLHLTPEAGRVLARAALAWLTQAGIASEAGRTEVEKSDRILRDLRIDDRARDSEASLMGWEQRLAAFGRSLRAWLKAPAAIAEVNRAAESTKKSHWAEVEAKRVEQIDMAVRLCRWMSQDGSETPTGSFEALSRHYANDLSYVDWARYALFHGDSQEDLNLAYEELVHAINERREAFNRTFANSLVQWTAAGSTADNVICIEDTLARKVAPVASAGPVLLVVLDGLSLPIHRQIAAALVKDGWAEAVDENATESSLVIAGLPTVTEWSRRLLLSGSTDIAPGADEAAAFRDAPALQLCSRSSHPPKLFRKGDLTESGGRSIAEELRREIMSPSRQVVGVVINAIDDHLAKDDQLPIAWDRQSIPILQQVVELAQGAGRSVVITSDHGHVVTHRARSIGSAPNDRYRLPIGSLLEEEVHFERGRGARFSAGGIFAPWSEKVFYTTRRNGLHGGVTPQEVLVPAAVFVHDSVAPKGWKLVPQQFPKWWWEQELVREATPVPVTDPKPARKSKPSAAEATLPLFAAASTPTAQSWIEQLFASELYQEQYKRAGRNPPNPDTIRKVLEALTERQYTLLKSVLAQQSGEPEIRLNGLLAMMRRILNVEGYPVLSVDDASGTVRLDIKLLHTQFELTA